MTKCQIIYMHKQILRFIAVVLVGLFFIASTSRVTTAENPPDLLTAPNLNVQKGTDVTSVPSSLNGNIDCIKDGPYNCVIDTSFGKFNTNGYVKPNKTEGYHELISFIDNKPRSIPIPSSNTIINYTTEPPYGFYAYFTKNLNSSVSKVPTFGINQFQYKINRPYDGKLVDKANHRLAADYESISFSANGQWMVVSVPNIATLRVNLETFEVVPFGPKFNYTIGSAPSPKTAITNDGRYAVVASKSFSSFRIYDLNSCEQVPDTISGSVNCQSRNLKTVMQQKVPGYTSIARVRFVSNNTLRLYAGYDTGSGNKAAPFTINPEGTGVFQHDYLALGDSYISGEGAHNYLQGTDTGDNKCHVSLLSHPYLLAQNLNYNSFHSVACSGAKVNDILNTNNGYEGQTKLKITRKQLNDTGRIPSVVSGFMPGYINQLEFVNTYQPQVITLSVGGNDVGFASILRSCVSLLNLSTCYSTYEDRLELVRQVNAQFPNFVSAYQVLKNASPPDTRIYVIGYPQIVKPSGDCDFNVQLNAEEVVFAQQFTDYLNSVIQQAAARVGVFYVDTQTAFNGHRLCEAQPGKFAVNGLTRGTDFPKFLGGFIKGPFGNESYHPTPLGYRLLRDSVKAATNGLSTAMPSPNTLAAPPLETGLSILNVAHSGRTISSTSYDDNLSGDILPRGIASEIFVNGLENSLKPLTSYSLEIHSSPVVLGNYSTNSSGDLSAQITIPSTVPTGFHSLHVYGTNIAGEAIDIYKTIYVAANGDDYNGNGVSNNNDPCVFVDASGVDYDQDGVDDACDGIIAEAPPALPTPVVNTPSSQPPSNTNSGTQPEHNNSSSDTTTSPSDTLSQIFSSPSFSPLTVSQSSSAPQTLNTNLSREIQLASQQDQPTAAGQVKVGRVLASTKTKEPSAPPKNSRATAVVIGGIIILLGSLGLLLGLRKK